MRRRLMKCDAAPPEGVASTPEIRRGDVTVRCVECNRIILPNWGKEGWHHKAAGDTYDRTMKLDLALTETGGEVHIRRDDYPNRAICGVGKLFEDALPGSRATCARCRAKYDRLLIENTS